MTENRKEIAGLLLVDDEENILRSIKRLFMEEDNIEVFTALSGLEGLNILRNNEVAVIVSDQRMPEMSGAEFLEQAREIAPDSIRMILTGYADINAAINAINRGEVHRYLTKPWNDDSLVFAIKDAIERHRLAKENKYLTELTKKQNEELRKWSEELEYYVQMHTMDLTNQNKELNRLNAKLKKNLKDIISSFSHLIELKYGDVKSHSSNVASISSDIAKKMGINEAEIETIAIAAQLHDIGKIGIPDVIMVKKIEELTDEEMIEYMKHPARGQAAICLIEDLAEAGVLVRHHHELYNGEGFPDKLAGNDIPLGSRIIAIADAFDRLIRENTGKNSVEETLDAIQTLLGIQFDPELGKFLIEVAEERKAIIEQAKSSFETELFPASLIPGMVVSRDVKTGLGFMLVSKGMVLTEKNIEWIKRYYDLDPSRKGIFVYSKRA